MLYNECEKKRGTTMPKMFRAEAKLRLWAGNYPNAYILGIFACCRQLIESVAHYKYISKDEATKHGETYLLQQIIKELETKEEGCSKEIA